MTTSQALAVVGLVAQIVGLAFVFREIAAISEVELGRVAWRKRIVSRWRNRHRRDAHVDITATASVRASAAVNVEVTKGPGEALSESERLSKLEARMDDLDRARADDREAILHAVDDRVGQAVQLATDGDTQISGRLDEIEDRRRELAAGSVSRQRAGAILVLFGLALQIAALFV